MTSKAYLIWGSTDDGGPFSSDHGKILGVALNLTNAEEILSDLQDTLGFGICEESHLLWVRFWLSETELFE